MFLNGKAHARLYFKSVYLNISRTFAQSQPVIDKSPWESVIGLEVHAQISSKSKLFSAAKAMFGGPINNQVAFLDAAIPGTLPVLNKRCVEAAVLTSLALHCKINLKSTFDRKHYFYADLPTGYQITQQNNPIAKDGHLTVMVCTPKRTFYEKTVNILQLQLEQDSGKSLHDDVMNYSLIDLNRAGIALMEIVTAPQFCDGQEAASFVKELQMILQRLGVCTGRMDEGAMRVDASISVRKPGGPLGTRTEVKNINSVRFIAKAIAYETERQIQLLESGHIVENETRSFDFETGSTIAMRDKEKVHDYRFMPEPNLPPLCLYTNDSFSQGINPSQIVNIDELLKQLPELPMVQRQRLKTQYNLTTDQVMQLVNDEAMLSYFENIMKTTHMSDSKLVMNILLNELQSLLNENDKTYADCSVPIKEISLLVNLFKEKKISLTSLKQVLSHVFHDGGSVLTAIEDNGLWQINDTDIIKEICTAILKANPQAVKDFRKGKTKVVNYLVGQVHKQINGRVDAKQAVAVMMELLQCSENTKSGSQ